MINGATTSVYPSWLAALLNFDWQGVYDISATQLSLGGVILSGIKPA
jgi:hypothetical protein